MSGTQRLNFLSLIFAAALIVAAAAAVALRSISPNDSGAISEGSGTLAPDSQAELCTAQNVANNPALFVSCGGFIN